MLRVAPCVGAWIETFLCWLHQNQQRVAPCVGAWIETFLAPVFEPEFCPSLPAWERGLKQKTEKS